jgi:serine phosphatase RsbU (regulator of sigma subunit)
LATEDILDKNLHDYFVFFQPKNVVSGDFYWASNLNNGNFLLACVDSTGHGVPGAIMSVLNISSLEKVIEKETEPASILNETRKLIIERLKKDGSAQGGKDGMDCTLVMLDKNKKQLQYAASNNPLWIVRGNQLMELPFDKMPVGRHDNDTISFTLHTVNLQPNDVMYTFTDGFADQFGGPNGKKFKYTRFKEVLLQISALPMQQQKNELNRQLNEWMGALEQVDDICIVAVRIR